MQIRQETYDNKGNIISTEILNISPVPFAKKELEKSDLVAMRCLKDGIAYPQAWRDYDAVLRQIVNTGEGEMPAQPTYP